MRCCALIPVYDHPHRLPDLLAALLALELPVVLVNDGSGPHCSGVLRDLAREHAAVSLVELPHNRGKGAAVKSGLREAARRGFSHALQVDADGQHELGDAPRLLAAAAANPEAMITGVPRFSNAPALRFYARYLTHFWVWVHTLSLDISDSMCGFRIYPLAATLAIVEHSHTGERMEFDTEIMVRLHWAGVPIVEVPTPVTYHDDGISHFRGVRDTALLSLAHVRLFFGMLVRLPRLLGRRAHG